MREHNRSSNTCFFLELILMLFLLVFTIATLLSAFDKANHVREASSEQTKAMIILQSVAEAIKAEEGLTLTFPLYYGEGGDYRIDKVQHNEEKLGGALEHITLKVTEEGQEASLWQMTFTNYRKK